jgi:high-affinity iron transporter
VLIGYLIYRSTLRLNLGRFFAWTGGFLILVAAGVLGYGIHDLQEGGVLPGLNSLAFDVSDAVPLSSWYGALLHGIFGFTPDSTWLQTVAYGCYLVPVMALFFRGGKAPAPSRQSLPVAAR